MKTIENDGKSHLINIEKVIEQGMLREKDPRPLSWEEYDKNKSYCYVPDIRSRYSYFNSIEEANAFCAPGKLIQLRDVWWGEWKPDWSNTERKYYLSVYGDEIRIGDSNYRQHTFAFPTEEMATDFLKTFNDLIKLAKMFL